MKQINPIATIKIIIVMTALTVLVACGPGQTAPPIVRETPTGGLAPAAVAPAATADLSLGSYPPPAAVEALPPSEPYPGSGQVFIPPTFTPASSYPPPALAEGDIQEPRFHIDPVSITTTIITGQAPPNASLAVMDITYNGALLGIGNSDANGQFSIPVSGLTEGNRVGVTIGELAADQTLEQVIATYFPHRGEGFMNLPNVGIFFDTTIVSP